MNLNDFIDEMALKAEYEELLGDETVVEVDGEVQDGDDDEESDLDKALYLLEDCLFCLEKVITGPGRKGRVVRKVPKGMRELMEEVSDFLADWSMGTHDGDDEEYCSAGTD